MRRPGRGQVPLRALLILVAVLLLAAGLYAWQQSRAREEAERQLGLTASRIVSERFSIQAEIKVGTLNGQVIARAEDARLGGLVRSEQTVRMPYAVDYFVDIRGLGANDYHWDRKTRTIMIDVPDVTPGRPNLDEGRAEVSQGGVWISRAAGRELARQSSARAALRVDETARDPQHLNAARANARAVIERFATGPLAAAGLEDVRVAVRFPWEPRSGGPDGERWDESRRIEDVLKERARSQTKTS